MLMDIMHFSHICVAFDCAPSRCKYLPLAFAQCCTTQRMSNIYSRSAFVCLDGVRKSVCAGVRVCELEHSAYAKHKHKQEIHFSFVCLKSFRSESWAMKMLPLSLPLAVHYKYSSYASVCPSRALIIHKLRKGMNFFFFFSFDFHLFCYFFGSMVQSRSRGSRRPENKFEIPTNTPTRWVEMHCNLLCQGGSTAFLAAMSHRKQFIILRKCTLNSTTNQKEKCGQRISNGNFK